jgi:putative PIN family toxin of toxin-antitoxin system
MPERVVFDTNVVVAGLLWRGKAHQCLLLARAGIVEAVYCEETIAELADVLRRKFRFSDRRVRGAVREVERFGTEVEISGELRAVPADEDDDKFVECAVVGRAGTIVSGDHHLLSLAKYDDIQIVSPAEFVVWAAQRPRPATRPGRE